MALVDKINYLIETKNLIKEALQEKGIEVTNTDSFRSYADKIKSIQSGTGDISEYLNANINGNSFSYIANRIIKKIPSSILQQLSQKNAISMASMFHYCNNLINLDLSCFNTSNVTDMNYMFFSCDNLETINFGENFDTSKVSNMSGMFYNCRSLISVPKLKANKVISLISIFNVCDNLTTLGGLENLGQAYLTTASANYNSYGLDLQYCNNLTQQSLINVINNLYDIATKGCKAQKLTLGATNIAKLTEEEIAIATEKGWTVS